jgi:hypothetical protein
MNGLLDLDVVIPEWHLQGLCGQADAEAWFPEKGIPTRPAKAICAACPVRVDCLEDALERHEPWGIWGGTSERERQRIRAERAAAREAAEREEAARASVRTKPSARPHEREVAAA